MFKAFQKGRTDVVLGYNMGGNSNLLVKCNLLVITVIALHI